MSCSSSLSDTMRAYLVNPHTEVDYNRPGGALQYLVARGAQDYHIQPTARTWRELYPPTSSDTIFFNLPREIDFLHQIWLQFEHPTALLPITLFDQAQLLLRCTVVIGGLEIVSFSGLDLFLHSAVLWKSPNLLRLPVFPLEPVRHSDHQIELRIQTQQILPVPAAFFRPSLQKWQAPLVLQELLADFLAEPNAPLMHSCLGQISTVTPDMVQGDSERFVQQLQSCWAQKENNNPVLALRLPGNHSCYRISILFLHPTEDRLWLGCIPFRRMQIFCNDLPLGLNTVNAWTVLDAATPKAPPGTYHMTFEQPPDLAETQPFPLTANSTLNLSRIDSVDLEITWAPNIPNGLRIYVSVRTRNSFVTRRQLSGLRFAT